jgi:RES domain-containing protein
MKAWRIIQRRHAKTAFSGEGARLYGGRWNSPGIPMVYVAQSQSLAVLEVLVHLDVPALLEKYVFLEAVFDSSLVIDVERSSLPKNWKSDPVPMGFVGRFGSASRTERSGARGIKLPPQSASSGFPKDCCFGNASVPIRSETGATKIAMRSLIIERAGVRAMAARRPTV